MGQTAGGRGLLRGGQHHPRRSTASVHRPWLAGQPGPRLHRPRGRPTSGRRRARGSALCPHGGRAGQHRLRLGPHQPLLRRRRRRLRELGRPLPQGDLDRGAVLVRRGRRGVERRIPQRHRPGVGHHSVTHGLRPRGGPLPGHRRRRRRGEHHPVLARRDPRRVGAVARCSLAAHRRPWPCTHGRPVPG